MPRVLPSQIVEAIESFFGTRNEIYSQVLTANHRTEVQTVLLLLDQLPQELIDLGPGDYVEFTRCRATLETALAQWNAGANPAAKDVGGKDPIERLRRLLKQCHDEAPAPEPELPFIDDDFDQRLGIEDQIRAAWTDFNAREWMGATVFAGAAMEALLLWALKRNTQPTRATALNNLALHDLIDEAYNLNIISGDCAKQARLAKDARNLVHPGKVSRSGISCSKASALSAFAGLYCLVEELKARP